MSLGFYYNQSACSGCRACQTACKDRNDLKVGELYRKVTTYQTGVFPNAVMYHYSASCNHCDKPECVGICPTGAMYKAEDGTVQHDDDTCIGCEACVEACPYNVPIMRRDREISGKCDACKSFRDNGMNPVCVDACNMRCLDFGDLDGLRAKYGSDTVIEIPVHPDGGTESNTRIKPKIAALNKRYNGVIL
jgi:anaerobic dimethyl sulfoxide reductase subunit B (iron-sulfur subunit)